MFGSKQTEKLGSLFNIELTDDLPNMTDGEAWLFVVCLILSGYLVALEVQIRRLKHLKYYFGSSSITAQINQPTRLASHGVGLSFDLREALNITFLFMCTGSFVIFYGILSLVNIKNYYEKYIIR